MKRTVYENGDVIFSRGDSGGSMYVVRSGCVGIFAGCGADAEKKLTELGAGKSFGEMAVIEGEPRSATAVALERTELDEIAADELGAYFEDNPEQMMALLRHMSSRLRAMTENYIDACGTIAEMERGAGRSEGLLAKIKKYLKEYDETQMEMAANGLLFYHAFY